MADDAQDLTLRPAQWDAHAERWLSQALAGASLADFRDQVEAGARLFHFCAGDQVGGVVLVRVDHTARGPEGVIVACAGELDGVDLVGAFLPAVESLFQGVRRIRYHTGHPALARKLLPQGYAPREIVCFKELT